MNDLPEGFVLDSELPAQPSKREQSFLEGMRLGAKKRALGVGELGLNVAKALGADVSSAKELVADVGKQYAQQGTGTGVKGLLAEIAGDPLTALPAVGLPKILAQGALMGATAPTGDVNSNLTSNVVGAGAGAVTSLGGAALGKGLQKVAKPVTSQLTQVGKAGIQKLEQAGVPLSAAQKTGSKALSALEATFSNLPMTSGLQNKFFEKQREAFTKAALKEAGIDANTASRQVIDAASKKFGDEYTALASKNVMKIDETFAEEALPILQQARSGRLGQDSANLVQSVIKDLAEELNKTGQISGSVYQKTRSLLTQKANSTKDSFDAGLMKQLRNSLDAAFERSLPASQRGIMADINKRYRAFKPIQKAMESSKTEGLRTGNIDPTSLYNQVEVGAPLSNLADAGAAFLRPTIPDSGTAQRLFMQNALTGGGVGGATYLATQDPEKAALAAGLTLGAPKAAQILYNSAMGQRYLTEGMRPAIQTATNVAAKVLPKSLASGVTLNRANVPQQTMEQVPVDSGLPDGFVIDAAPEGFVIDEQNIQYEPMSYTAPQSNNQYFNSVKMAESSGNPNANAATSSASGLYQFTDQTWKDSVAKWGKKYGITERMKNNPQAQEAMVRELAADNARILTNKLNREPNVADMYVAHVFGADQGAKLINNLGTNKPAFMIMPPRVVNANTPIFFEGRRPRSVDEVYALLWNKIAS